MLPNLDKLEAKCKSLGLSVKPSGRRLSKDDCVKVLRKYYLDREFPNGLPYDEVEPMLCFAEWNLKPEEIKKVWESPNWVAQQKFNGCRVVLHFVEGVGVFAHSRTVSLKNYRFQELTPSFLFRDLVPSFTATVDAEAMIEKPVDTRPYTTKGEVTKSSLHSVAAVLHLEPNQARRLQREQEAPIIFKVFDVMRWGKHNLKGEPLERRLQFLYQFVQPVIEGVSELAGYFEFPFVEKMDKREFCDRILAAGGEGVILKNLRSPYVDSSSRRRDAWVKVKKRIEFDAFVTGFIRGEKGTGWENLVGALEFSVFTETGEHHLASCSNLTLEFRKEISVYDPETDTVSLKPEMYGKVAQVSGQDVSARSYRLSHATLDRWREGVDEKAKDECKVSMADLREAAEWVS